MSTPLEKLEAARDAALASLKEESDALRLVNEEEERVLKKVHARRFEIQKAKAIKARAVTEAQARLDALEQRVPRELTVAISEREAAVNRIDFDLRGYQRDLASMKYNLESLQKKGARREEVAELVGEITQMEAVVSEAASDLDEAKKGLEAAQILRREALEQAAAEAQPVAAK